MAFENFPAAFQEIFQSNMLARRFEQQLATKNAYRRTAFRLPVPVRSGESITYSRAGRISPTLSDIVPSSNTGLDNGVTGIGGVGSGNNTYPFEQWSVSIGMSPYFMDLNLVQEAEVIADLFKQNVDNLSEHAGLSLDLRVMQTAFNAYTSGQSFATGSESSSDAHVHMDNVLGLDKAFATSTMVDGSTFPTGAPQPVSGGNPLAVNIRYAATPTVVHANTIIGVTVDNPNTSLGAAIGVGASGIVQLGSVPGTLLVKGDVIEAADKPSMFRPNGRICADALTASDTIGAQLVINAVNELRANGVKSPLSDGTYPCYIDPLVDAQFFTDAQYQIMSQGTVDSQEFKGARLNRNFGVTFVPTTNSPAFVNAQNIPIRHCIITGDKYVQQSPFAGTAAAIQSMPDMGVSKFDIVDDIVFVNRMPLDRAGQILSMGWYYIGGYAAPTDATITSAVVPSASAARYKRASVIQVAAAR